MWHLLEESFFFGFDSTLSTGFLTWSIKMTIDSARAWETLVRHWWVSFPSRKHTTRPAGRMRGLYSEIGFDVLVSSFPSLCLVCRIIWMWKFHPQTEQSALLYRQRHRGAATILLTARGHKHKSEYKLFDQIESSPAPSHSLSERFIPYYAGWAGQGWNFFYSININTDHKNTHPFAFNFNAHICATRVREGERETAREMTGHFVINFPIGWKAVEINIKPRVVRAADCASIRFDDRWS